MRGKNAGSLAEQEEALRRRDEDRQAQRHNNRVRRAMAKARWEQVAARRRGRARHLVPMPLNRRQGADAGSPARTPTGRRDDQPLSICTQSQGEDVSSLRAPVKPASGERASHAASTGGVALGSGAGRYTVDGPRHACAPCGVAFHTPGELSQHVAGPAHARRVAAAQKEKEFAERKGGALAADAAAAAAARANATGRSRLLVVRRPDPPPPDAAGGAGRGVEGATAAPGSTRGGTTMGPSSSSSRGEGSHAAHVEALRARRAGGAPLDIDGWVPPTLAAPAVAAGVRRGVPEDPSPELGRDPGGGGKRPKIKAELGNESVPSPAPAAAEPPVADDDAEGGSSEGGGGGGLLGGAYGSSDDGFGSRTESGDDDDEGLTYV